MHVRMQDACTWTWTWTHVHVHVHGHVHVRGVQTCVVSNSGFS